MKTKTKSISAAEYQEQIKPKRRGIGEEDHMHIQFGCLLQKYEKMGKMPDIIAWSYFPAGEYRKPSTASMLKKKGVACGWPDYIFLVYDKRKCGVDIYFLEFKTEKGTQQKTQRQFELSFAGSSNTNYRIARSVEEGINFVKEVGILINI